MSPTPNPPGTASDEEAPEQTPPIPDEDGPHDVPDDKVIEKTLPARKPGTGTGSNPR